MEISIGVCLEFHNPSSIRVKYRQNSLIGFIRAGFIELLNRADRANQYMPCHAGVFRDAGRTANCQNHQEGSQQEIPQS